MTPLTAPHCMSLRNSHSKTVMGFICEQQRYGNANTHEEKGTKQLWAAPNNGTHSMFWCQVHEKEVSRAVHCYPTTQPQKATDSRQKRDPAESSRLNHCIRRIGQITLWILCEKSLFLNCGKMHIIQNSPSSPVLRAQFCTVNHVYLSLTSFSGFIFLPSCKPLGERGDMQTS